MGDATNLVLILAGELLKKAGPLLVMGLHPSEVIQGYELASIKALAELESTFYSQSALQSVHAPLPSPLRAHPLHPINPPVPDARAQACNRVKTVWVRGHIGLVGCRGRPLRHAAKSKQLQCR